MESGRADSRREPFCMPLRFPVVHPHVPNVVITVTQDSLEGVSSDLAQVLTWTEGELIRIWWSKLLVLAVNSRIHR